MNHFNTIGLYIADILYGTGGTESYTVKLCYALQLIYPIASITFVSECYKKSDALSSEDFVKSINNTYGVNIDFKRTAVVFIPTDKSTKIGSIILRKRLESVSSYFDLFFYCSRGNYMFKARKNIHIIHFPTKPIAVQKKDANPLIVQYEKYKDRAYLKTYDLFLTNSKFTDKHFKLIWQGINDEKINKATRLCYHPVAAISEMQEQQKEKMILVLSRIEKSKHLETLIDAYNSSTYLKNHYRLVIAGGCTKKDELYKKELEKKTRGSNISFILNAPFSDIVKLYNSAEIFWHCKGFEIDESKEPELMEHFGMSTVEAMSAGCVPVVINAGGQKEIVDEKCGYRWDTVNELVRYTEQLAQNPEQLVAMSLAAKEQAKQFSFDVFIKNMKTILEELD